MNNIDPVSVASSLIRIPSVSGSNDGSVNRILTESLGPIGFTCENLEFDGNGSYNVKNLFAYCGDSKPHICFLGHSDVVPPGSGWTTDPFSPVVSQGELIGRGTVDMKGAIACFVAAVDRFIRERKTFKGRISLLISGDEEKDPRNGTPRVINWLAERKLLPDVCLVGEPTSETKIGDTVKIGRRGSLSAKITVFGIQGDVAYPENCDNPISKLLKILRDLKEKKLDQGSEFFDPSNLEITNLATNNPIINMIPGQAEAWLNIRFNSCQSNEGLRNWIAQVCSAYSEHHNIEFAGDGDAFLNDRGQYLDLISKAVELTTKGRPRFSTGGGTSDARYIHKFCPTIELGLCHKTAHGNAEKAPLIDLTVLTDIYYEFLNLSLAH